MSRYYTCSAEYQFLSMIAPVNYLVLSTAVNRPIRLVKVVLSQVSAVRDANESVLSMEIRRFGPTVTEYGFPIDVPDQKVDRNDSAAGGNGLANSMPGTNGTDELLDAFDWNVREPCERVWDKRFRPNLINGQALLVRQLGNGAAPAMTVKAQGVYEEV